MARLFAFLLLGTLVAGCRHGRCFADSDCSKGLVCAGEAVAAGPAKRCAAAEVKCVRGCVARCTADSCGRNEVCGEAGCCEPKGCKLNNDCAGEASCIDGRCTPPGKCSAPAE